MDESRLSKKTEMIIDCHCHSGKGDGLTGPWDTNARSSGTILVLAWDTSLIEAIRHNGTAASGLIGMSRQQPFSGGPL
jgi:hypothetical protein